MLKETFDPYHKWLAIPPDKQPPNHYQLLGVEELESDPDVIDSAADQRMAHLRSCQSGKHGEMSQQLLNEISAARITLLNADKKALYDKQLGLAQQPAIKSAGPEVEITTGQAFANDSKQLQPRKSPLPIVAAISVAALVLIGVVVIAGRSGNGSSAENVSKSNHLVQGNSTAEIEETNTNRSDKVEEDSDAATDKLITSQIGKDGVNNANKFEESSVIVSSNDPPNEKSRTTPASIRAVSQPQNQDLVAAANPPTAATRDAGQKAPAPTREQQKDAQTALDSTFRLSDLKTSKERIDVANRLIALAAKSSEPVERFVILRGAMRFASAGGDAQLVMRCLSQIDREFEIDRLAVAQRSLQSFADGAVTADAIKSLVTATHTFNEDAIRANRSELANQLTTFVYNSVLKKRHGSEFRKQLYDERSRVQELHKQWSITKDAFAKLVTNPNDPEANGHVGKYICFMIGDWDKGLEMLAKGANPRLQSLAKMEMGRPRDAKALVKLADGWFEIADKLEGISKQHVSRRAANWYAKALPELSVLAKARVERQLSSLEEYLKPLESTAAKPAGSESRPVDLLALVVPERDAVVGKWRLENQVLVSPPGKHVYLELPYDAPEEYVLTVEFDRTSGSVVVFGLVVSGHRARVEFDSWSPSGSGLGDINKKLPPKNSTWRQGRVLGKPGEKNTILCTVRRKQVTVVCNNKEVINWTGDPTQLSDWVKNPNKSRLYVCNFNAELRFSKITISPVNSED